MATVQQEVAALYSAIFNRAPDQAGLNNWVDLIQGGASLTQTADGFVQHPVFTELYAGLTNIQFIQELYINVLGSAGDAKGIQNWANLLASGVSKAQVVADFVRGALDVDLDAMLASGELTQAEYDAAVVRQDTLTNKANVGIYFAETFGAASNLNPATDTSTVAGLQADPAYLASQAAIANVTADAASVAAAKGRIDVAVTTDNPAGNLVGANSELTAALVEYQAKVSAEDAALDAVALAENAAKDDPLEGTDLDTFVKDYELADAVIFRNAVESKVSTANGNLATANNTLATARANTTDAALNKAVADALTAVKADSTAKGLYDTKVNANAKVATDVAANGDSVKLLTDVRAAIAAYVDAGGDVTVDADAGNVSILDLLDALNTVLNADPLDPDYADDLVDTIGEYDLTDIAALTTASGKALDAALDKIVARDDLVEAAAAADSDFAANGLGGTLVTAEAAVDTRQGLIEKVTDAQTAVSEAQTALAGVNSLYQAYLAAVANKEAAQEVIEGLGYKLATDTGTADDDLFVADLSDATIAGDYFINGFGAAGNDVLFIGNQYKLGAVSSETLNTTEKLLAAGSTSSLEVFLEAVGANTTRVHVETKAFANGSAEPADDLVTITLTGVALADVTFENGYIVLA